MINVSDSQPQIGLLRKLISEKLVATSLKNNPAILQDIAEMADGQGLSNILFHQKDG